MIKKVENKQQQQNDFDKIKKKKHMKLILNTESIAEVTKRKQKGKANLKQSKDSMKLQDIIAIKEKKKKKQARRDELAVNPAKEMIIEGDAQAPAGEGKKRKRNRKRKSSEGKAETSYEVTETKDVNVKVPKIKNLIAGHPRQEVKQVEDEDATLKSKKSRLEAVKHSADSARPKNFNKQSSSESAVLGVKKRVTPRKNRNNAGKTEAATVQRIVIVDKLPIRLMHTFKGLIEQRFSKYGRIHHVGPCEFDEDTADKEFKTSIVFKEASSATKALEEDNLLWEGGRLEVFRANEAKDTTLVVRKMREFKEALIRSIFAPCGAIRRINSRKFHDFYTVFVEFWKPESLKEALTIAGDIKLGGRKLLVAPYDSTKKPRPALNLSITLQE